MNLTRTLMSLVVAVVALLGLSACSDAGTDAARAAISDGATVIDVRTPAEYATGFVPGSLNIPHTELRDRLDEVRDAAAGRPVRVMCQSGVRSAIAHRIVAQSGFDSASLSGGMLTLRAWLGERQSDVLERPEVLARA